jgi:hypothetical protein
MAPQQISVEELLERNKYGPPNNDAGPALLNTLRNYASTAHKALPNLSTLLGGDLKGNSPNIVVGKDQPVSPLSAT